MRKILVSVLCFAMVAALMVGSALADATVPLLSSNTQATADVFILGKNAKAVVSVSAIPVGYSVSTSVSLQKKVSSAWTNVASAAGTRDVSASASAIKGVTYRAYAICKIYDSSGNLNETLTLVSETRTY
ncbi:MAG: hypothetical protein J1E43_11305 [Christensenellaceae bacterium]|nr:hypothetical protein [Christensenellaceae bacterium]